MVPFLSSIIHCKFGCHSLCFLNSCIVQFGPLATTTNCVGHKVIKGCYILTKHNGAKVGEYGASNPSVALLHITRATASQMVHTTILVSHCTSHNCYATHVGQIHWAAVDPSQCLPYMRIITIGRHLGLSHHMCQPLHHCVWSICNPP